MPAAISPRLAVLTALAFALTVTAQPLFDKTSGTTTLFAFDDVSIPHSQNLRLEMRAPVRHPANPVLARGEPGTPDSWAVQFYGSIIRVGDKFRLWYVAVDDNTNDEARYSRWRAAYAESTDGIHWVKPNLGLVEYKGSKNNNLIDIGPHPLGFVNLKVLHEPDASDPAQRYKATGHIYFKHKSRLGSLAPFSSADGLTWKLLIDAKPVHAQLKMEDLVLPGIHYEPCGGLYKWDGLYYISGQNALNAARPYHGRVTRMFHSADFIHWSHTSSIGFIRFPQHTLLGPGRSLEGEQTHEGISVWNRGNVLLGVVGLWHGAKEWKDITIDLGFVVSNDGVKFREPAHEWTFLKRGEDGQWDEGGLLQAQGFENVGEQTFIYYGTWDPRDWKADVPRGGVGLATLPRDRFGDLVVEKAGEGLGNYQLPKVVSEFVTAAVALKKGKSPKFFVNADGLGPEASIRLQLLDEKLQDIPGYAATVTQSGFQTPIVWKDEGDASKLPPRVRFRAVFEGARNTDIRFSALYLRQ